MNLKILIEYFYRKRQHRFLGVKKNIIQLPLFLLWWAWSLINNFATTIMAQSNYLISKSLLTFFFFFGLHFFPNTQLRKQCSHTTFSLFQCMPLDKVSHCNFQPLSLELWDTCHWEGNSKTTDYRRLHSMGLVILHFLSL